MFNKENFKSVISEPANACIVVTEKPKHKSANLDMKLTPKSITHERLTPQAQLTKTLITAAQNGDKAALEQLCRDYEPLFRKEMRREIFYNALGFDDGLSIARLKFIELILTYNGTDFVNFPGYVRCRIHFALYDAVKKVWAEENKTVPPPQFDEAEGATFSENVIERHELSVLLSLALAKLPPKQRLTIEALYINGYNGKETAALLNCTPATVTKHHKQALISLKSKIG